MAVDVTGHPVGALEVPASTLENRAGELMLEHPTEQGVNGRLELVLVDPYGPSGTPDGAEVAHGRLGRSRRMAKSFENTTTSVTGWLQVACIATTLRHLSGARAPPTHTPGRSVTRAECGR